MAVIITLAMVLLMASVTLAVTGTAARGGRRAGKRALERGNDRNRTDSAHVPVPPRRARPDQGSHVGDTPFAHLVVGRRPPVRSPGRPTTVPPSHQAPPRGPVGASGRWPEQHPTWLPGPTSTGPRG